VKSQTNVQRGSRRPNTLLIPLLQQLLQPWLERFKRFLWMLFQHQRHRRKPDGSWWVCNDDTVTKCCSLRDVSAPGTINNSPCLLLYEKKNSDTTQAPFKKADQKKRGTDLVDALHVHWRCALVLVDHFRALTWMSVCLVCLSSARCSARIARECTCFRGNATRWCGCACWRRVVLLVRGIAMCHGRADVAGLVEGRSHRF
jgi:hypothetical protein